MKHKDSDHLCVSFRASRQEQENLRLIMQKRKFNSYSHTLRIVVAEAAEKILATDLSSSVDNRSTSL